MAKRFDDLADEVMEAWPAEAHQVYQAARGAFQAEMREQAELGRSVAEARRSNDLTQAALSELSGIQQAEISRIERGLGNPTAVTLQRLAHALGRRWVLARQQ